MKKIRFILFIEELDLFGNTEESYREFETLEDLFGYKCTNTEYTIYHKGVIDEEGKWCPLGLYNIDGHEEELPRKEVYIGEEA